MGNTLFFFLIRISLGRETTLSYVPNEVEWQEAFAEAKRQALIGVCYMAIERLPAEQRPPRNVLLNWYGQTEFIKVNNRRLNKKAASLTKYFAQLGVRSTVLKGQGVAQSYPEPLMRVPGDIDLWVEGGRRKVLCLLKGQYKIGEVVYHHADFSISEKVEVEVHFRPSWSFNYFRNRRWQFFFAEMADIQFVHRVKLPEKVGEIATPTGSFNCVYLLMHIYRHLFDEGIGLRQLLDYYYSLRQSYSEAEKQTIRRNLSYLGLSKFASAVMYVEQVVFGLEDHYLLVPIHESEGRFLLSEIMKAGNFGQYDERNRHSAAEGLWGKFCRKVWRNSRFVRHYPSEVLWSAPFKIWHFCWRKSHGYL